MYMILSRTNEVEHNIIGTTETISEARALVWEKVKECGNYADRLHPAAFKIVELIETAPVRCEVES